jgi:4-hydroxy-tetrahydrodipicolinate synthase
MNQLEELAKLDRVVAIKEAGDSIDRLTEISSFGDELYLYAGNDTQIYATLALGGKGVISVVSNLYPHIVGNICKEFFNNNFDSSRSLQYKMTPFTKAMFYETNPAPIKYAMSLSGLCASELRLPLLSPENSTRGIIEKEIKALCDLGIYPKV